MNTDFYKGDKIYSSGDSYCLIESTMQEALDNIDTNSMDAIITDPPYHLESIVKRFGKQGSAVAKQGKDGSFARLSKGFMGKEWDGGDISFQPDTWARCFRVLKPGGYLLSFGGSRTFHRIACAIEDAGFDLRDTLFYMYGTGFPKGENLGLAVDKATGRESIVIGEATDHSKSSPFPSSHDGTWADGQTDPAYNVKVGNNEWAGWGSCLKPAYEPIIMARKPLEGTLVDNTVKYGLGGLNIDGCRVGGEDDGGDSVKACSNAGYGKEGRYPSNIILDGSSEVTRMLGEASRFFYCAKASTKDRDEGMELDFKAKQISDGCIRSNPDAACKFNANPIAKRNTHPTVKPTELMQYLIRLVSPKGSVILDPFNGSGSTGKAVMFENRETGAGYKYVGIEMTHEYLPISEARIKYAADVYAYEKKKDLAETGQERLF